LNTKIATSCILMLVFAQTVDAETITVTNLNDSGAGSLRDSIEMASDGDTIIFTDPFSGNPIVLESPIVIDKDINIQGMTLPATEISGNGETQIFQIKGAATVNLSMLDLFGGVAENGGAILNTENSILTIKDSEIRSNGATAKGGAIHNDGATLNIIRSTLSSNIVPIIFTQPIPDAFGGAISNEGNGVITIDQSTFALNNALNGESDGGAIANLGGTVRLTNSTVNRNFASNNAGGISNSAGSMISLIRNTVVADNGAETGVGFDIGNFSTASDVVSGGYNFIGIAQGPGEGNTLDVFSTNSTDQFGTVTSVLAPELQTASLLPGLSLRVYPPLENSPLIDGGIIDMINPDTQPELPCGYKDTRGIGRPQDGNGDGIFECDIGAVEIQGGPDLTAAQSGAYFDPSRNGEGSFIEILDGGDQALVATFTYTPSGESTAWFIGIGDVIGNSIVVDDMLVTEGGVFGSAFDPNNITRSPVGSLSFIFPNCQSAQSSGRLSFDANDSTGYQDVLLGAARLTSILDCENGQVNPLSGRSGSFFSPQRDGEGIFVEWLADGRAIVIWYTYDPQGNQFWTISNEVIIEETTLRASMLYPQSTTAFGNQFNAEDVSLADWGTITLDYQPGCADINFSYESIVEGFGSGQYDYSRLSQLDEVACDL